MKKLKIKKVKENKNKLRLFPIVVITSLFLAIIVMCGSFTFTKKAPIGLKADYGGEENILNQTGNWIGDVKFGYFNNKIVIPPKSPLALESDNRVLSLSTAKNKFIEIVLSQQIIRAYEDGIKVYEFPISSGLPWTPTVTGDFNIWYKTKWTRMTGGSKEDGSFYDLPNVPYTMFFYKDYGIHGAYWHNNFGHPMSHGCVNMKPDDAQVLFYWTDPPLPENSNSVLSASTIIKGTRVIVRE